MASVDAISFLVGRYCRLSPLAPSWLASAEPGRWRSDPGLDQSKAKAWGILRADPSGRMSIQHQRVVDLCNEFRLDGVAASTPHWPGRRPRAVPMHLLQRGIFVGFSGEH